VAGRVARVDVARPSITISTQDCESLVLVVNSKTKLLKDGKNINLSAFKKGNSAKAGHEIVFTDGEMK